MSTSNWFDDLPVLSKMPPQEAIGNLRVAWYPGNGEGYKLNCKC